MRTARSSSCLLGGVCLSACWDTPPRPGPEHPYGVGLETPRAQAWTPPMGVGLDIPQSDPSTFPLGVCLKPPPPPTRPLNFPPWVWAWRSPLPDPSTSPLGVGLETPPVDRILDTRF